MGYRVLADAVLVIHAAFVAFVVLGGLLVLRWPAMAWAHVPAAAWGALIEFSGWICPLTPLENALRARGGASGYRGGFIEHYVLHMLYPDSLTRDVQWTLGSLVILINAGAYALVAARRRRMRVTT
jgi:uncharacterized protein DUF2784